VILADEADNKRIRIHPALQAAGNSNLKLVYNVTHWGLLKIDKN
jgi:hypothetical protein